jgi:hypothetical protein
MFAYMTAKYLKGHKNVRVISLGTGRDKEGIKKDQKDTKNFNKFDQFVSFGFMKFLADFDMTMVSSLFKILPQEDYQFVRANVQTLAAMDSWTEKDFQTMRDQGAEMFKNHKDEIMGQIKIVLEQAFNK